MFGTRHMYDAQDLVRECLKQRKTTGRSWHATANHLLRQGLVEHKPSLTAVKRRLTVFKRNLACMPQTRALMKVEPFRRMGRPAIIHPKRMKTWCVHAVKQPGSSYGIVKRKLTACLKEMGHEGKISRSTIWRYQQKMSCVPASILSSIHSGRAKVLQLPPLKGVHYDVMVIYLKDKEYRYCVFGDACAA